MEAGSVAVLSATKWIQNIAQVDVDPHINPIIGTRDVYPDPDSAHPFVSPDDVPNKDTLWVGILLVLLGSALLNLGLNIQKFALRRRLEAEQSHTTILRHFPSLRSLGESVNRTFNATCLRVKRAVSKNLNSDSEIPAIAPSSPPVAFELADASPPAYSDLLFADQQLTTTSSIATISNPQNLATLECTSILESASDSENVMSSPDTLSRLDQENEAGQDLSQRAQETAVLKHGLNFKELLGNPIWVGGLALFCMGNLLDFVALKFAAQSLIAPLGSFSLVVNVIIAPCLNAEKYSWKDIVGIGFIVIGACLTVIFAGVNNTDYELSVLLELLKKPATIVFLSITAALVLFFYLLIKVVEKNIENPYDPGHITGNAWNDAYSRNESEFCESPFDASTEDIGTRNMKTKRKWFSSVRCWWRNVNIIPKLRTPIPLHSRKVQYVLPFAYASLGGLMATITVLFAKSTIHLLTKTFEGDFQYQHFLSWFITIITVVTAVSQIYWINMGLQRYDALLQIPVFYVVWTVMDIIGGGVYFEEFRHFGLVDYVLFISGVAIIFIGVGFLAERLRSIHNANRC